SQIAAAAVDKYLYPAQPYLFRWFLSGRAAATAQMAYVERQMRAKNMTHPRIAVIRYDSTGTAAWFEAVSDALKEKGWTPVEVQVFPATATDVTPAASAVAASRPDFVLSALTDTQAPLVVAGIRQRGSQAPIVNYVGSAESMLQRVRDPNLLVIREWTVPTDPTVPALKEMLKDAQEAGVDKDITVNLTATAGYVMGMVLEAAAKRCGWPCDPVKYRDALESIDSLDTKGLSGGPVGVSKDDHLYPNYATLYRWDDQKGHSVPEGDPIAVQ
ncbi:MAG: ABC transporter substrate-binding protein, partial [Clostridia bacterium]|nr:ABC transporter substrate-binding protein [Clostridia bacterium]